MFLSLFLVDSSLSLCRTSEDSEDDGENYEQDNDDTNTQDDEDTSAQEDEVGGSELEPIEDSVTEGDGATESSTF
jgi:hypothetical protein